MRYINLTKEEAQTLEESYKYHSKSHVRRRSEILLLNYRGTSIPELVKLFGLRSRTIYTWLNRWEQFGFIGLLILPGRGRKPTLSTDDRDLLELLKKKVRSMPVV